MVEGLRPKRESVRIFNEFCRRDVFEKYIYRGEGSIRIASVLTSF